MEIEGDDGSAIELNEDNSKVVFGRGSYFKTKDITVSRRHILFEISNQTEPRVSFEVLGKNPVWIKTSDDNEGEVKVFRRCEKGEVAAGDWFCISSQYPVWFKLKRIGVIKDGKDLESIDLSMIDPVKEFGFLVIGHEFDCYPKQRIKDYKNWEWFLEESNRDSSDDESVDDEQKKRVKRKRKKGEADDEDWGGESEEDKEIIGKTRKVEKSKYSTRSKDKGKSGKDTGRKNSTWKENNVSVVEDEDDDDDENDETLGGFIVTNEEEEVGDEEEDEEEELMDDDELDD